MKPGITSTSFAQRVLQAYQPLHQHGLLIDGQYRLPSTTTTDASSEPPRRRRMLLIALCGLVRPHSSTRSLS